MEMYLCNPGSVVFTAAVACVEEAGKEQGTLGVVSSVGYKDEGDFILPCDPYKLEGSWGHS